MLSRLVVAVAVENFFTEDNLTGRQTWFSTKELLNHITWVDRKKAAPITTALKRQAKRGYFKSKKDGYYWMFAITEAGVNAGHWAINHAVGLDEDVEKYVLWKINQNELKESETK